MANAAPWYSTNNDLRMALRRALTEELAALPDIDTAYVTLEGSYVTVRAFARETTLALAEQLVQVGERLDERFPDLCFEVIPRAHQGQGALRAAGGADPDYERPVT